jgi:DNA-directed RNA polymerase specialized sigma24 family protein
MTAAAIARLSAQAEPVEVADEWTWEDGADPDLWMYRERTLGMLKRYMRLSIEVGRLPSVLGREFFRTRVTSYSVATFEDTVIFVHDVENCLAKLDGFSQALIAKIVLQEYSQEEAARLLGCWRRTVGRRYPEALDRLSRMFLDGGLLRRMEEPKPAPEKTCQEEEIDEN